MTHPPRVEHTKTPWEVYHGLNIRSKTGRGICSIGYQDNFDPTTPATNNANALFIVEACNAYEANQKALQVAVEALEEIRDEEYHPDYVEIIRNLSGKALERIREIQEAKP